MADCRIECLGFRQRQATGIGQEKAGWQVIRQFSAQGLDGPPRQDRNAVHGLGACRVIIKDHHLLRPLTACGTDGWMRVIHPGWWEAVQDIGQQQTRWVHAELPSSGGRETTYYRTYRFYYTRILVSLQPCCADVPCQLCSVIASSSIISNSASTISLAPRACASAVVARTIEGS